MTHQTLLWHPTTTRRMRDVWPESRSPKRVRDLRPQLQKSWSKSQGCGRPVLVSAAQTPFLRWPPATPDFRRNTSHPAVPRAETGHRNDLQWKSELRVETRSDSERTSEVGARHGRT